MKKIHNKENNNISQDGLFLIRKKFTKILQINHMTLARKAKDCGVFLQPTYLKSYVLQFLNPENEEK